MADFAKAQLLKYGWTEGKGLGKRENGITKALKPKLKFNTEGLGHKLNQVQWWESTFDNAAKNLSVTTKNDKVTISVTDEGASSGIKEENSKESRLGQERYNNFRKSCTLQDEKLIAFGNTNETIEEGEKSVDVIPSLTDEELFKACGGRTAHKGARHGLSLSGKLERIARQEKQLLDLMSHFAGKELTYRYVPKIEDDSENEKQMDDNANAILAMMESSCNEADDFVKSNAALKKEKKRMRNLSRLLSVSCHIDENNSSNERSSLKRKRSKSRKTNFDNDVANGDVLPTIKSEDLQARDISVSTSPILTKKHKRHKKHDKGIVKKDGDINLYGCTTSRSDSRHDDLLRTKEKRARNDKNSEISAKSSSTEKGLLYKENKMIKLMGRMCVNFDNSKDRHVKNVKKRNDTFANVNKLENTYTSKEELRLHKRALKAKKNRRKKNKQKIDLERRVVTFCPKKELDDVTENLMSDFITEDVSAKLKKSQKLAKKQKKIKEEERTEIENCYENRTDT